jgi:hypothetical protein
MALLTSPCCIRRVRAPLVHVKRSWKLRWDERRCPRCHFVWQLRVTITKNGFVSRAWFSAPGKHRVIRKKRAKKRPKKR